MCPLRNDTPMPDPFHSTGPFNMHGYKHMPIKIILEQQIQSSSSFKLIPPVRPKPMSLALELGKCNT